MFMLLNLLIDTHKLFKPAHNQNSFSFAVIHTLWRKNQMLYNLPLLSNQELQHLFVFETKRFMDGLNSGMPFIDLVEIRQSLKQIADELDQRRLDGRLEDK